MFALIFAPGFGGGLSEFGLAVPFFVSATLAFLGGLLAIYYLKESMKDPRPMCGPREKAQALSVQSATPKESDDGPVKLESGEAAVAAKNDEELKVERARARILHMLFACGALLNFGFRIFIMMGPLWVYKKFGWEAAMYGFVTSGVGW